MDTAHLPDRFPIGSRSITDGTRTEGRTRRDAWMSGYYDLCQKSPVFWSPVRAEPSLPAPLYTRSAESDKDRQTDYPLIRTEDEKSREENSKQVI